LRRREWAGAPASLGELTPWCARDESELKGDNAGSEEGVPLGGAPNDRGRQAETLPAAAAPLSSAMHVRGPGRDAVRLEPDGKPPPHRGYRMNHPEWILPDHDA
jgi:hypothetical protein